MDLHGNIFDLKISRTQESIRFLQERIEGLSPGAKALYLAERQHDLKLLLGDKKFYSKELENYNFSGLIESLVEDMEKYKTE